MMYERVSIAKGERVNVLVTASRKGGAGKSTLSGHIAVEAERQGAGPAAIIDMAPMGSLAAWWNERAPETPLYADVLKTGLSQTLQALEQSGIKSVVIDTPP